jgi:hypothetical protein
MTATKATRAATAVAEPTEPTEPTEPKAPTGWRRPVVGEAVDTVLHTYEQLVANFVEFEHKAAAGMRSERAKAAINLHATFIEDLTAVYVRTARAALR